MVRRIQVFLLARKGFRCVVVPRQPRSRIEPEVLARQCLQRRDGGKVQGQLSVVQSADQSLEHAVLRILADRHRSRDPRVRLFLVPAQYVKQVPNNRDVMDALQRLGRRPFHLRILVVQGYRDNDRIVRHAVSA